MKVYRNVSTITQKEQRGRRLSSIGLGILFVGLLASFVPTWYPPGAPTTNAIAAFLQQYWVWVSFIALPAGFIFASFGSYNINRFARRRWPGSKSIERPDEMLERSMKGFDDKYSYFAWSLPANYVVVGPCGILIFAVRSDKGKVSVRGDRWREPFSLGRIFTVFAREGVGNPAQEIADQERKLRELMGSGVTAEGDAVDFSEVPIQGAVVFLNADIQLDVDSPNVPALRGNQLKDYIRRQSKEVKLQTSTLRAVTRLFAEKGVHQQVETVAE